MAFHLGCLRALHDLGVLDHIAGLSTISGGSVVGAYYAYTPGKSFIEFESDIRGFLRKGFSRAIIAELFKPGNACRSLANVVTASANVLGRVIAKRPPKCRARRSRTDLFEDILRHRLFPNLKMGSPRRGMEIFVGACDLRTESGFRFGNAASGSWRLGRLIQSNIDVALAVAASAAYPLFLLRHSIEIGSSIKTVLKRNTEFCFLMEDFTTILVFGFSSRIAIRRYAFIHFHAITSSCATPVTGRHWVRHYLPVLMGGWRLRFPWFIDL